MDVVVFTLIAFAAGFSMGYMLGTWNGYFDAQPKRDRLGRFTKRK